MTNSNENTPADKLADDMHEFHEHLHRHHACGPRRFIKIPFFIAGIALIKSTVVFFLWNHLVPDLFHGPELTYLQAIGITVLAKILLGGGHFGGPHHHHGPFGRGRWGRFTEEEKALFRETLRKRHESHL